MKLLIKLSDKNKLVDNNQWLSWFKFAQAVDHLIPKHIHIDLVADKSIYWMLQVRRSLKFYII